MIDFIFCVHNHQPVGNFDYVMEDAYARAYEPFLKKLSAYPRIKFSFHISGYLLDWLSSHRPGYIALLREMVERGQVEMMGGGYYEPILSVVPRQDALGQLRLMTRKINELFGTAPKGAWLAERVWDPTLPLLLKEAEIEHVVVDDYHFVKAGLKRETLNGYYITDELGALVRVFPGSERLRYLVPFERVEKLKEHLVGLKGGAAIFADDGEKFGVWPGTARWVFDEGWLDSFLSFLSGADWIRTATFSEYIEKNEPLGRVYLPTTSYMEMGEWALPAEASKEYTELVEELKSWKDRRRVERFLQGGMWRNFLAKYPEANWMHKRMLLVSGLLGKQEGEALKALYMAQCNDAYWHGVFGGLYLPHLRAKVYENLIKAENSALVEKAPATVEAFDVDADTFPEIVVRTEKMSLFFSPHDGAALQELDWRPGCFNLSNTLSRWFEGYHMRLKEAAQPPEGAKSIHGVALAKEKGLEKYLKFDRLKRCSLREHLLSADATLESFASVEETGFEDFPCAPYGYEMKKDGILFKRTDRDISVTKDVTAGADRFSARYRMEPLGSVRSEGLFFNRLKGLSLAVEFNFCFPGCNGPLCRYEFPEIKGVELGLGSAEELKNIRQVALVDGFSRLRITLSSDPSARLWRYPVETVSLSEAGFERIYQGSSLVFVFPFTLPFEAAVTVKVEEI
jgi:alpha-amylase